MLNNSAKQQSPLKSKKPLLQNQRRTNQMETTQETPMLEPEGLIKPPPSGKSILGIKLESKAVLQEGGK